MTVSAGLGFRVLCLAEEIAAVVKGAEEPNEDALIKARGIAEQRGVELSSSADEEEVRE